MYIFLNNAVDKSTCSAYAFFKHCNRVNNCDIMCHCGTFYSRFKFHSSENFVENALLLTISLFSHISGAYNKMKKRLKFKQKM